MPFPFIFSTCASPRAIFWADFLRSVFLLTNFSPTSTLLFKPSSGFQNSSLVLFQIYLVLRNRLPFLTDALSPASSDVSTDRRQEAWLSRHTHRHHLCLQPISLSPLLPAAVHAPSPILVASLPLRVKVTVKARFTLKACTGKSAKFNSKLYPELSLQVELKSSLLPISPVFTS